MLLKDALSSLTVDPTTSVGSTALAIANEEGLKCKIKIKVKSKIKESEENPEDATNH